MNIRYYVSCQRRRKYVRVLFISGQNSLNIEIGVASFKSIFLSHNNKRNHF